MFHSRRASQSAKKTPAAGRFKHPGRALRIKHFIVRQPLFDLGEIGNLEGPQRLAFSTQAFDRFDDRASFVDFVSDLFARKTEVLGDQAVAYRPYRRRFSLAVRLNDEVALAIESKRAVIHIRRTDPQRSVVDDQHFGVNIDRLAARGERIVHTQTPLSISSPSYA